MVTAHMDVPGLSSEGIDESSSVAAVPHGHATPVKGGTPGQLTRPPSLIELESENVKVIVRIRPSLSDGVKSVTASEDNKMVECESEADKDGSRTVIQFPFDSVFQEETTQEDFFSASGVMGMLDSCLQGFRCTVFAYGQTSAGKTFTMSGKDSVLLNKAYSNRLEVHDLDGLMPRSVWYIYDQISELQGEAPDNVQYKVSVSYMEIYNEQLVDLLAGTQGTPSKDSLQIRWNPNLGGFYVDNLTMVATPSRTEALKAIFKGLKNRKVGSHAMNHDSSRSHSIMTIYVDQETTDPKTKRVSTRHGKVSFCDLAGSERNKDTKSEGQTLKEAGSVNKSLFTLGNVLSALTKRSGDKLVPYRNSKLTTLLIDSLGGNAKTLMVACCLPLQSHIAETLRTLSFANKAKHIKNRPQMLLDPQAQLIENLKEQIRKLKTENRLLRKHLDDDELDDLIDVTVVEDRQRKKSPVKPGPRTKTISPMGDAGDQPLDSPVPRRVKSRTDKFGNPLRNSTNSVFSAGGDHIGALKETPISPMNGDTRSSGIRSSHSGSVGKPKLVRRESFPASSPLRQKSEKRRSSAEAQRKKKKNQMAKSKQRPKSYESMAAAPEFDEKPDWCTSTSMKDPPYLFQSSVTRGLPPYMPNYTTGGSHKTYGQMPPDTLPKKKKPQSTKKIKKDEPSFTVAWASSDSFGSSFRSNALSPTPLVTVSDGTSPTFTNASFPSNSSYGGTPVPNSSGGLEPLLAGKAKEVELEKRMKDLTKFSYVDSMTTSKAGSVTSSSSLRVSASVRAAAHNNAAAMPMQGYGTPGGQVTPAGGVKVGTDTWKNYLYTEIERLQHGGSDAQPPASQIPKPSQGPPPIPNQYYSTYRNHFVKNSTVVMGGQAQHSERKIRPKSDLYAAQPQKRAVNDQKFFKRDSVVIEKSPRLPNYLK
eukprot:GFYU01009477.1.p1 GENE.GFYU01009477.1~~GFYU01009477.1.p1  ORF type:complete len:926 (+),score=237.66 GFYU01009477.1:243-3020(+)